MSDVAGGPYGVSIPFRQQDLVRNQLPQALNYQSAMHFSGGNAQLLELTDTPSNIGQGGYSQSPLPTTPASTQLANPVQVRSLSASLADVPAQTGADAKEEGAGNPSVTNTNSDEANGSTPSGSVSSVHREVDISAVIAGPDAAQEPSAFRDRSAGKPKMPPANQDESELREAYNQAQATEDAVPSDGSSAGQPATPAAGDTQSAGFPAFFTLRLIVDISAAGAANFVMAGKAKANAPVAVPSDKLTKADAKLAEAVKQVTEQMEKEGWTPEVGGYKPSDGGAYGKEVEKRVAALMEGGEEFTFEVYVDKKTNKVLSIGEPPDGVPSRDYTQVDVVRSKVKVEVGTTLGTVNVEEVYDIKTAASGDVMSADQRHRLSAVKFGVDAPDLDARKIKVVTPPRHYSPVHGWQDHPRFGESGIKLLQFIGPATAVYLMLTADDVSAHELKDLIHGYAEVKNDPAQLTGWVLIDLKPFLERYIADGNLVKVALYAINRRLQLESQKRN